MIRHEGRFPARLANDLRRFYAGADRLWTPVGVVGADAAVTGQLLSPKLPRPSGLECNDDCTIGITGYIIGSSRTSTAQTVADALDAGSLTLPRWNGANFYDQLGDITGFTSSANGATTNCPSPCSSSYTQGQIGTTARLIEYNPAASTPGAQFVGNSFPTFFAGSYPVTNAQVQIAGTGFGIGDLLKRMRGLGATCVDARMEVQFSGLSIDEWRFDAEQPWTATVGGSPSAPDLDGGEEAVVNGVTVLEYQTAQDGTVTLNDTASPGASATSGSVNFTLMGKAPRTASLVDLNGNPTAVTLPEFDALGASVSVSATSGNYAMMDATSLISALLSYNGDASGFFLWPSLGNPLPGSLSGMRAYLSSIEEVVTLSSAEQVSDTTFKLTYSVSGRRIAWTALTIGTILARFRLPSGIIEDVRGPLLIQPRRA
jgi:hypothetical protein